MMFALLVLVVASLLGSCILPVSSWDNHGRCDENGCFLVLSSDDTQGVLRCPIGTVPVWVEEIPGKGLFWQPIQPMESVKKSLYGTYGEVLMQMCVPDGHGNWKVIPRFAKSRNISSFNVIKVDINKAIGRHTACYNESTQTPIGLVRFVDDLPAEAVSPMLTAKPEFSNPEETQTVREESNFNNAPGGTMLIKDGPVEPGVNADIIPEESKDRKNESFRVWVNESESHDVHLITGVGESASTGSFSDSNPLKGICIFLSLACVVLFVAVILVGCDFKKTTGYAPLLHYYARDV